MRLGCRGQHEIPPLIMLACVRREIFPSDRDKHLRFVSQSVAKDSNCGFALLLSRRHFLGGPHFRSAVTLKHEVNFGIHFRSSRLTASASCNLFGSGFPDKTWKVLPTKVDDPAKDWDRAGGGRKVT
jgi:hypothetical protein